jgi:peptidyl-prolyl cis-trans isomerase SurA
MNMRQMRGIKALVVSGMMLVTAALSAPHQTLAQDLFAPVMIVNDHAITRFEQNQRVLFLQLLRQPGDLTKIALESLIDERLQAQAAKQAGLILTPEQIKDGMTTFALQANLTSEEFITAIGQGGVEPQTFRDFVEAGQAWRELIRAKYGPQVQISNAEVDRAIAAGLAPGGPVRVLLSEIVLPTNGGVEGGDALALARRLKAEIKTLTGFGNAARRYSISETAPTFGRLEWQQIDALPAAVGANLRAMDVGTVSEPFNVAGGVVLYFLRNIGQEGGEAATTKSLDYAQFLLPENSGTSAEVARLTAAVDTCDSLYAQARRLPADQLTRQTVLESQVPADIGRVLARLDANETDASITRGGARVFVMLCSRTPTTEVPPSREEVRNRLLNLRLAGQAQLFLSELRAEAIIRTP